jgi:hypothetical protein
MNKPHKHAECIKAWADGAEIEYWSDVYADWHPSINPSWHLQTTYRIKPQPVIEKKFIFAQHFETKNTNFKAEIWPEGSNYIGEAIIQVTLTDGKVTAVELLDQPISK